MFSKFHKARLTGAKMQVVKNKDGDKLHFSMELTYDFTHDLAENMDTKAVMLLETLEASKDARLSVDSMKLKLDTDTVQAKFKHKGTGEAYTIARTVSIAARCSSPTATSTSASVVVQLTTELDLGHVTFAANYLNEALQVRLDRQQLELPNTADQPVAG